MPDRRGGGPREGNPNNTPAAGWKSLMVTEYGPSIRKQLRTWLTGLLILFEEETLERQFCRKLFADTRVSMAVCLIMGFLYVTMPLGHFEVPIFGDPTKYYTRDAQWWNHWIGYYFFACGCGLWIVGAVLFRDWTMERKLKGSGFLPWWGPELAAGLIYFLQNIPTCSSRYWTLHYFFRNPEIAPVLAPKEYIANEDLIDPYYFTVTALVFITAPRAIFTVPIIMCTLMPSYFISRAVAQFPFAPSDALVPIFSVFLCGLVVYLERIARDQFLCVADVRAQADAASNAHSIVQEIMHALVPPSVLRRLVNGKKIADGGHVTVMFADVAGFTAWCSNRSASNVVESLNRLYRMVDTAKKSIFPTVVKVKTIGDAYWAMCGLPDPCDTHALTMVKFAYWMRDAVDKRQLFTIRYGCHSGMVVCGVVGLQNFSYEPFGATNELAEAVETSCPKGSLLITYYTRSVIQNQSPGCKLELEPGPDIVHRDTTIKTYNVLEVDMSDHQLAIEDYEDQDAVPSNFVAVSHTASDDVSSNSASRRGTVVTVMSNDRHQQHHAGGYTGIGEDGDDDSGNESHRKQTAVKKRSRQFEEENVTEVGSDKDENELGEMEDFFAADEVGSGSGSNKNGQQRGKRSGDEKETGSCVDGAADGEGRHINKGMRMLLGDEAAEDAAAHEAQMNKLAALFEKKYQKVFLTFANPNVEEKFLAYCSMNFRMTSYGGNVLIFVMFLTVYILSLVEGRPQSLASYTLRAISLAIPFVFMVLPQLPVYANFASLYIGYILVLVGTFYTTFGVATNEIIYIMVFYSTAGLCRGVPMVPWIIVVALNILIIIIPMMVVNEITIGLRVHHLYHPVTNIASWLVAQRRLEMSARDHFQAQALAVDSKQERMKQFKGLSGMLGKVVPYFIIPTLRDWFQSGHSGYPSRNYHNLGVLFLRVPPLQEADILRMPARLISLVASTAIKIDETIRHFPEIVKVKTVGDIALIVSGVIAVPKKREDPGSFLIDVPKGRLMFPHYDLGQLAVYLAEAVASAGDGMSAHIGIHTGPVTCGIIGTERPIFDAFGDTVNVAARIAAVSMRVVDDMQEKEGATVASVLDGVTPRTDSELFDAGAAAAASGGYSNPTQAQLHSSTMSHRSNKSKKVTPLPIFASKEFVMMFEMEEENREQKKPRVLLQQQQDMLHFQRGPQLPNFQVQSTDINNNNQQNGLPPAPSRSNPPIRGGTDASSTGFNNPNPLTAKSTSSVRSSSSGARGDPTGGSGPTTSASAGDGGTVATPIDVDVTGRGAEVVVDDAQLDSLLKEDPSGEMSGEEMVDLMDWTSPASLVRSTGNPATPRAAGGGVMGATPTTPGAATAASPGSWTKLLIPNALPPLPDTDIAFGREVNLEAKGKVSAVIVRRFWKKM